MVSFAHAKINLGLNVLRKRADGFHDLETCFYPVPWTDVLEIIPAKEFQFSSSGLMIDGIAANNLCVKAFQLLQKDFNLPPVQIHLHKVIPMGAGLGGGSSDGAFTLRMLNDMFELKIPRQKLIDYAARLGSDCAFFVSDEPKIGTGRGEILSATSITLKGKWLVLVKPPIHVSTVDAFAGIVPRENNLNLKDVVESKPVTEWKALLKNDFEETVFRRYSVIREIKETLYARGAAYASMSGSGSSVFGIFENGVDLKNEFSGLSFFQALL
ncbi:MAG TPA: 4-(cytidine 5'-diphospho)-2-C-methyl-D-erythritol kinase [Chryseosolibacter sp.]